MTEKLLTETYFNSQHNLGNLIYYKIVSTSVETTNCVFCLNCIKIRHLAIILNGEKIKCSLIYKYFVNILLSVTLPMMTSCIERCHVESYEFLVSEVDNWKSG